MVLEGYIKLYRKVMDSPVWDDPNYLKLWMFCLMKATHKEREALIGNQVITLEPGQFITGRKSLAEDLNKGMKPKFRQSEISWWRYLNNLEKQEMLNIKKTNKYSVVSINKWNDYQQTEQQMNNKRTSNEQQMNTNKNVKNEKNEKNNKEKRHKYEICDMTLAELLLDEIRINNSGFKQPNLEKWASDIRLMRERDSRTAEQIKYLITWSQQHEFWKANILSPTKLRTKFDTLVMQVKQDKQKAKSNVVQFNKKEAEDDGYNYGF